MTVSPTNIVFYVANASQGVTTYTQTYSNVFTPWGGGIYIGTDPTGLPSRSFVGSMSSFAMFTNTLTVGQIENLYDYGSASGTNAPMIVSATSFVHDELLPYERVLQLNDQRRRDHSRIVVNTGPNGDATWQVNTGGGGQCHQSPCRRRRHHRQPEQLYL